MVESVFRQQYEINRRALGINLDGVSENQALFELNGSASMNWIVGHMLRSRSDTLEEAGAQRLHDQEELLWYRPRHEAPERQSTALSLTTLLAMMDETSELFLQRIATLLESLPEDQRDAVVRRIAFRSFHESYHCGQIAILRRALGMEGMIA